MIVTVEITGQTALLMNSDHKMLEGDRGGTTPRAQTNSRTPREIAVDYEYRNGKGNLFAKGTWFEMAYREAASYHKQKGTRKTMKTVASSAFNVVDEEIELLEVDSDSPITTYEIDTRCIVNGVTHGRQPHHRPRIERWRVVFDVRIDERLLDANDALNILNESGYRCGVGSFRISHGGRFGRFAITGWEVQKDTSEAKIVIKTKVRRSMPGNGKRISA